MIVCGSISGVVAVVAAASARGDLVWLVGAAAVLVGLAPARLDHTPELTRESEEVRLRRNPAVVAVCAPAAVGVAQVVELPPGAVVAIAAAFGAILLAGGIRIARRVRAEPELFDRLDRAPVRAQRVRRRRGR